MKSRSIILIVAIAIFALMSVIASSATQQKANEQDPAEKSGDVTILRRGGKTKRQAPQQLEPIALKHIAERENVHLEDLHISGSTVSNYRELGKTFYKFDVRDKQGTLYTIALDEKGETVDEDEIDAQEIAAHRAKYGKLSRSLHKYLQQNASSDKEIEVLVEVQLPPDTPDMPVEPDIDSEQANRMTSTQKEALKKADEEYLRKLRAYHENRRKHYVAPVIERMKKLGYKVTAIGHSHRFSVKVKPEMIRDMETWDEVREIHIVEKGKYKDELDISRRTIGADLVESRGVNGSGINVASLEVGGRIYPVTGPSNPFLTGISQSDTFICPPPPTSPIDEHAVAVAGVIRSTATLPPVYRGISPLVNMFQGGSCQGLDSEFMNQTDAFIALGVKIFNIPFGHDSDMALELLDKFYDEKVKNDRVVIVKSAGNEGTASGNVTSPGLGYNIITVGGFNDMNTQGWDDDRMDPNSSFNDPISSDQNDRNKPEISAPGVLIITTLAQQFLGQWFDDQLAISRGDISGTSIAAPHVTGTAALIHHRANLLGASAITSRPELVKAILLASAGRHISFTTTDVEGTGALSASWADDVVTGTFGGWGKRSFICTETYPYLMATLNLQAGIPTRVVLTWNTDPSWDNYFNKPSSDLNLRVNSPSGQPFFSSVYNDTYEWIEFIPNVGGNYTLFVEKRRCKKDPGSVAYAYWQMH